MLMLVPDRHPEHLVYKVPFLSDSEVTREFRAVSSCLLVGTQPVFLLFLHLPLHSRRAAVDSEQVAYTWCCLREDYRPIIGWFLKNALCCRASMGEGPECKYLVRKEVLRRGEPSCGVTPVASVG